MTALIAAAKAEGGLTTIALPRSWCGYGALLDGFTAKYGIPINNLNPDGSSQQELDAITANESNKGPAAPDVIDVGLSYGPKAVAAGLLAPYEVSTWGDIPASAKDASGNWYSVPGQGYVWSAPMDADEVPAWITDSTKSATAQGAHRKMFSFRCVTT